MKINQVLVEAQGATVAFAFGRFNPAHQGHIAVWRAVEDAGANWFIGTNPSTLGPNDPLTFEQKSAWMEEIYPPISGHIVAEQSVLTLAAYIFKKLRKNERATVAYITDETDWAWSGKLLNQYNGVQGAHGYYKFAQIIHVPSPRVSSATALRDAARADDKVAFYHASGTDPKAKVAGLTYFDTVKQACEKYPLPVKKAKKVKEEQIDEIDRRGFLKGMGAAAVAGAAGYKIGQDNNSTLVSSSTLSGADLRDPRVSYLIGFFYWCQGPFGLYKQQENRESLKIQQDIKKWIKDWDTEENHLDKELDNNGKSISMRMRKERQSGQKEAYDWFYHEIYKESDPKGTFERFMSRVKYEHSKLLNWNKSRQESVQQSVTEDEQKTVAKTWDQMTPQEKISGVKGRTVWNEKTKKYYTVFDVPAKEVDEASLATMRDYFAGDENARDPYEITKQRLHFAKDKNAKPTLDKRFRSPEEYQQWLAQNKLKQISGVKEDEEQGEVKKTGQLIPWPSGTTKVHVSDVYDWYKLGMVISDLDDADPKMFGQGAPQSIIAFGSEEEESKLLPLLSRLGLRVDDIDPEGTDELGEAYHAGSLYEMLKKERTKGWSLKNKRT